MIPPPIAVVHPNTSIVIFILFYFNKTTIQKYIQKLDYVDLLCDSIGLGIFVVVGINTSMSHYPDNTFLILFTGLITSVGGGVLRDVLAMKIPMILRKRIYAVAALTGGTIYYLLYPYGTIAIVIGTLTTIIIRLLAAHYKWSLPRVKLYEKQ